MSLRTLVPRVHGCRLISLGGGGVVLDGVAIAVLAVNCPTWAMIGSCIPLAWIGLCMAFTAYEQQAGKRPIPLVAATMNLVPAGVGYLYIGRVRSFFATLVTSAVCFAWAAALFVFSAVASIGDPQSGFPLAGYVIAIAPPSVVSLTTAMHGFFIARHNGDARTTVAFQHLVLPVVVLAAHGILFFLLIDQRSSCAWAR